MSFLAKVRGRVKAFIGRHPRILVMEPVCVVCWHGAGPVLGVPIHCVDGHHRHLLCMTIGRQIGEAEDARAERAVQEALVASRLATPASPAAPESPPAPAAQVR